MSPNLILSMSLTPLIVVISTNHAICKTCTLTIKVEKQQQTW